MHLMLQVQKRVLGRGDLNSASNSDQPRRSQKWIDIGPSNENAEQKNQTEDPKQVEELVSSTAPKKRKPKHCPNS